MCISKKAAPKKSNVLPKPESAGSMGALTKKDDKNSTLPGNTNETVSKTNTTGSESEENKNKMLNAGQNGPNVENKGISNTQAEEKQNEADKKPLDHSKESASKTGADGTPVTPSSSDNKTGTEKAQTPKTPTNPIKKKPAPRKTPQNDRSGKSMCNEHTEFLENAQLTKLMSNADIRAALGGQTTQGGNDDDSCRDTIDEVDSEMMDLVFSPLLIPPVKEEKNPLNIVINEKDNGNQETVRLRAQPSQGTAMASRIYSTNMKI